MTATPEDRPAGETGQPQNRLNILTPLLEIPSICVKWVGPVVLIALVTGSDIGDLGRAARFAIIAAVLGMLGSLVRYFTLRFGIVGDQIIIRTGLIQRRNRTIPLDQIQNIDLRRGPLQRLFGVTSVRIETAGGAGAEATLSVVSEQVAERFRTQIIGDDLPEDGEEGAPPEVLLRLGFRELLLAGATETRIGLIVGAIFGLIEFLPDTGPDLTAIIERAIDSTSIVEGPLATTLAISVLVILVLLAGWMGSIILTAIRYYGFTVRRSGDGLRRSHGLFAHFETILTRERIQLLIQEANPLRRAMGYAMLRVQTAGSVKGQESSGSTVLFPLLSQTDLPSIAGFVFSFFPSDPENLRSVHPLALRRGFIRYALLFSAGIGVIALVKGLLWLAALPLLLLLALYLAHLRYRALGWRLDGDYLIARAGIWTRRLWFIPRRRIQTVVLRQSPFQRHLGLATVSIDTAGSSSNSAARIIDLELSDAEHLFGALADSASTLEWAEVV